MRNRPTKSNSSEEVFSLAELTRRVKALEHKAEQLEGEIRLTGPFLPIFSDEESAETSIGRKPKLAVKEVLRRRDDLSCWIEMNWHVLAMRLLQARNKNFAAYEFVKAKRERDFIMRTVPFHREPENFAEELWRFLQSKRYAGNPRNLAGAMAGLPEISWKRSLDISQKHPMTTPLLEEAWRDHLRRKFPDRFRELKRATTVELVTAILRKSKSFDPTFRQMKRYPERVLETLIRANVKEPGKAG